ncbi:Gfo/Idh/MocA family protein [Robiginitalea biformata]|uniref:Probable NADH-dependent dyhydrogenase n=1 Tax=Robiginitalea biformata (strain ATCC BAA-864 / DSM 15991 / KCTC 12146 / HTCC2501) TaxID=313596 RepID=A4CML9_ROBBH|nr:Gfo/Idh/MocA family oxidoreductase [Robiginitalea biformata]EAR14911.1 probable NADH-dependent dyhydrogenase [Robiginitalea biformata HTCC2501]
METRRSFIRKGALGASAAASALLVPAPLWSRGSQVLGANDRIGIGLIGCNGMGFSNLSSFLKLPEVQVTALCDVDQGVLERRTAQLTEAGHGKPKQYGDYRELLENADVDIVIIGTPDHWHCLQLLDALDAGKDVYCEKPIANSIEECDRMLQAVEGSGRMVQIGQWQRSQPHFVDAIDFLRTGALGPVRLAKAWAYQGWMQPVPVLPHSPAPEGVDYKMWLGPAPERPFNPNRFHFNFRWFWDYAGGLMTDWGVHLIDYALYGMEATAPNSVMASGGKFAYADDASETPDTLQTVYEFDGFNLLWEHATGIDGGNYGRNHGIAFIGNNGTLVLDRGGWEVIPEVEHESWRQLPDQPKMEAVPLRSAEGNGLDLHTANFLEAVRNRDAAILRAPIRVGYHAARVSHMGNIAYKTGRKLKWDAGQSAFTDAGANRLMRADYHNGWELR